MIVEEPSQQPALYEAQKTFMEKQSFKSYIESQNYHFLPEQIIFDLRRQDDLISEIDSIMTSYHRFLQQKIKQTYFQVPLTKAVSKYSEKYKKKVLNYGDICFSVELGDLDQEFVTLKIQSSKKDAPVSFSDHLAQKFAFQQNLTEKIDAFHLYDDLFEVLWKLKKFVKVQRIEFTLGNNYFPVDLVKVSKIFKDDLLSISLKIDQSELLIDISKKVLKFDLHLQQRGILNKFQKIFENTHIWKYKCFLKMDYPPISKEELLIVSRFSNLAQFEVDQSENLALADKWKAEPLLKCISQKGDSLIRLTLKALPKPLREINVCSSFDVQVMVLGKLPNLIHLDLDLNFAEAHRSRWNALAFSYDQKKKTMYQMMVMKKMIGFKFRREILWEMAKQNLLKPTTAYMIEQKPGDKTIIQKYSDQQDYWQDLFAGGDDPLQE